VRKYKHHNLYLGYRIFFSVVRRKQHTVAFCDGQAYHVVAWEEKKRQQLIWAHMKQAAPR
jgi:hypothetical protein